MITRVETGHNTAGTRCERPGVDVVEGEFSPSATQRRACALGHAACADRGESCRHSVDAALRECVEVTTDDEWISFLCIGHASDRGELPEALG